MFSVFFLNLYMKGGTTSFTCSVIFSWLGSCKVKPILLTLNVDSQAVFTTSSTRWRCTTSVHIKESLANLVKRDFKPQESRTLWYAHGGNSVLLLVTNCTNSAISTWPVKTHGGSRCHQCIPGYHKLRSMRSLGYETTMRSISSIVCSYQHLFKVHPMSYVNLQMRCTYY